VERAVTSDGQNGGKQGILAAQIMSIKEGDGGGATDYRLWPSYSSAREESGWDGLGDVSGWDGLGDIGAQHGRGETVVAGAHECALRQERADRARR
jgi:hypothetical protein